MKKKYLSPERIDAILQTLPFPVFYAEDESLENVLAALYVEEIGEQSAMLVPEYIDMVKENADGSETYARYALIDATSDYKNTFPEFDN
jgi:hypothetical protein